MATNDKVGLPDFLKAGLDFATGLFTRKIDLELGQQELLIAQQTAAANAAEARAAEARAQAAAGAGGVALDQNTLLLIGAAIVGVLIITRL
jgi:hypothetical protein